MRKRQRVSLLNCIQRGGSLEACCKKYRLKLDQVLAEIENDHEFITKIKESCVIFNEYYAALLNETTLKAIGLITKAISDGDTDMAKWFLERVRHKDFMRRSEHSNRQFVITKQITSQQELEYLVPQVIVDVNSKPVDEANTE